MNTLNRALACVAAVGLVLVGTAANAEAVRSAAATPGVVSAKAIKLKRVAAPAGREARAVEGTDVIVGAGAAGAAGLGLYLATKDDDSPGG